MSEETSLFEEEFFLTRILGKKLDYILTHDKGTLDFLMVYGLTAPAQHEDVFESHIELERFKTEAEQIANREDFLCGMKAVDEIITPQVKFIKQAMVLDRATAEASKLACSKIGVNSKNTAKKFIKRNQSLLKLIETLREIYQSTRFHNNEIEQHIDFMHKFLTDSMSSGTFDVKNFEAESAQVEDASVAAQTAQKNEAVTKEPTLADIATENYHELVSFVASLKALSGKTPDSNFSQEFLGLEEHAAFELELLEEETGIGALPVDENSAGLVTDRLNAIRESLLPFIHPMLYVIDYAKADLPETIYYSSPIFRAKPAEGEQASSPLSVKFDKFLKQYEQLSTEELDYAAILNIVKAFLLAQELYRDVEGLKSSTYLEPERFPVKI